MRKGIAISPGIVVAKAYRMDEALVLRTKDSSGTINVASELARFDQASEQVAQELDHIIDRVAREVDEDAASIFHGHRLLVRDPALVGKVKGFILNKQVDAAQALKLAQEEYSKLFERFEDEYLRERLADIKDVVGRIVNHLTMAETHRQLSDAEPVILVAPEILPSQAVTFEKLPVAGIVTESGGSTGHAAILARSRGIPAVSGIRNLLREVHTGDLLIVDGREGILIINPGPEVESAYRKMQREYVDLRHALVENRDQEPITADGELVELLANVNNVLDAASTVGVGGSGVGLFRSEFVFLTHPSIPSEADQLIAYQAVIEAAPNNRVTIRTLDLGGDKQVPYLGSQKEANPFMGWRSIRMTSDYPEFFQTQLRAILRAGKFGNVSILFPMVTTFEEVQRLRRFIQDTKDSLRGERVPFNEDVPFGAMIEVPAAAICIDQLLDEVDFVSIGSNDLIQYIMAADRDNPKVAHLCEPFHPAIFRILEQVITACIKRGKPITLCGEMAASPACVLPLLGIGLRKFSMSPAFIPTVKEMIRSIKMPDAVEAAKQVVKMKTVSQVRTYLSDRVRVLCPQVAKLDTM
jgi:phosphotransferase system enzyme I (PtsI)